MKRRKRPTLKMLNEAAGPTHHLLSLDQKIRHWKIVTGDVNLAFARKELKQRLRQLEGSPGAFASFSIDCVKLVYEAFEHFRSRQRRKKLKP